MTVTRRCTGSRTGLIACFFLVWELQAGESTVSAGVFGEDSSSNLPTTTKDHALHDDEASVAHHALWDFKSAFQASSAGSRCCARRGSSRGGA